MKTKISMFLAAVVLAACGGGGGDGSAPASIVNTPPVQVPGPTVVTPVAALELAVAVDRNAVRVYGVDSGTPALVSTSALPGIPGAYARSGNTITVTMPNHGIRDGLWVPLNFAAGTGGTATSGNYKVSVVDGDTFTVTDAAAGTITGGTLMRDPVTQMAGTYAQSGPNITITVPNHGLSYSDGVRLHFISGGLTDIVGTVQNVVDANTITVTAPFTGTATGSVSVGVGTNYTSFDVAMHPSGKWLYVTSGYDCSYNNPYCWGGDVITQYAIDWYSGKLTAVESQRTGTDPYSIPVTIAINAAGTRLVNQDDDLRGLRLWTIDTSTGHLSQVADSGGGTASGHGIAFSADGNYVYQGSTVFQVTTAPDAITTLTSGSGTTTARLVNNNLYTIGTGTTLSAYALTDPTVPALITSVGGVSTNRDLAVAKSGSLMVTSGPGGISTYTFDGTTLALATPVSGSAVMQADGTASLGNGNVMYRGVALNDAGNLVVASYFTTNNHFDYTPSGIFFAKLGADGGLTQVVNLPDAQYARAARIFKNPTP